MKLVKISETTPESNFQNTILMLAGKPGYISQYGFKLALV